MGAIVLQIASMNTLKQLWGAKTEEEKNAFTTSKWPPNISSILKNGKADAHTHTRTQTSFLCVVYRMKRRKYRRQQR